MKKEQTPNVFNVKNDVENVYFQEKYRHYISRVGSISFFFKTSYF